MKNDAASELREKFTGMLQGISVGDALGLPAEGLSPVEIERRWRNKWEMRLIFGRGMISDDTEHALLTAECLVANATDANAFQRTMARKLRWWFLALPPAIGLATARACLKLLCGWPLNSSGVRSAGNGALIRAVVIGAFFSDDAKRRAEFIRISTRLTHVDERAEIAANAVAEVAALAMRGKVNEEIVAMLKAVSTNKEWQELCIKISEAAKNQKSVAAFAGDLGLANGVTGYCFHTAPVVIYAFLKQPNDFKAAIESVLNCGGDTDSTGAIIGGFVGACEGAGAVPQKSLGRICDWPNSVSRINRVAVALGGSGVPLRRRWYFLFAQLARNLLFLVIVVLHGFYRLIRVLFLIRRSRS